MQIIKIFKGSGYGDNEVCSRAQQVRLEKENYCVKTLRTTLAYGMNERTRNNDKENDVFRVLLNHYREKI